MKRMKTERNRKEKNATLTFIWKGVCPAASFGFFHILWCNISVTDTEIL